MRTGSDWFSYYTNQEHKSIFKHHGVEGPCICTFAHKSNNIVNVLTAMGKMIELEFNYSKTDSESPDVIKDSVFYTSK
jgi:hypothetical protein